MKVVMHIATTRTESQIRGALVSLRTDVDAFLQSEADSDPQTTLVSMAYKLKVSTNPGNQWVYPKMNAKVDSTRTEETIANAIQDSFVPFLKGLLRPIVNGDAQTSIDGWHQHWTSGAADEVEP